MICSLLTVCALWAQGSGYAFQIDKGRMLFHDNVDKLQVLSDQLDGKKDLAINLTRDETANLQISQSLLGAIDLLQEKIELDSSLTDNAKKKYLRGLDILLKNYNLDAKKRDFNPLVAPELVQGFADAMQLDRRNESIFPVITSVPFHAGKILTECFSFPENSGVQASKLYLIRKYIELHPDQALPQMRIHLQVPFADSIIIEAAKRDPRKLYDYAAANDALGSRIRSIRDPHVQLIAKMANSKSGQLYFPFMDGLQRGQIRFEDIDQVKDDELQYYRLLVKTRMAAAERMIAPHYDTAIEMESLARMMSAKARGYFIGEINRLHDVNNDAIRFKVLDPLTPQELYYLCVLGEDEIYTSSYLGVFKRIFQRMKTPRGDSLLMSVHADYFRKFIKMAAAYNTLDTLLKSMPPDNATALMRAFMFGLEKTTRAGQVEDAVDVADSYSSIFDRNGTLADFMLQEADWNLQRVEAAHQENGEKVYGIIKTLFESADTSRHINLTTALGIPPVYTVDYGSLTDDSGRVVQQVFFYGDEDKDGQNSYVNFMGNFRGKSEWTIAENPDWVSIKSNKGKPVWIFANKPLYGEDDPDEKAQQKLNTWLSDRDIHPSIFIHRGHSYHVKYSLQQIQPSARVVILGSCGGYNNLHEVLQISRDAHIISSKQVGTKAVNDPILQSINTSLRGGRNIEWIPMWRDLSKQFTGEAKEKFDDYIPPYKNLGVIFMKAYQGDAD